MDNDTTSKRLCLGVRKVLIENESSSEFDSEDEQANYQAEQVRAKKRASNRVSFTFNNSNSVLSRAVSQYSDDDEHESEDYARRSCNSPTGSTLAIGKVARSASFVSTSAAMGSDPHADCRLSAGAGSLYPTVLFSDDVNNDKKMIPDADKQCRARCFDYLVGAIDEAWARYCDATTSVEDEVYGYSSGVGRCPVDSNTPASVATDEEDYFGNATDFTDYDTDFDVGHKGAQVLRRPLIMPVSQAQGSGTSYSAKDPSSCKLQALKDRLTKAKYYLQDLTDSDIFQDVVAFWKRWDMIKYATIELVEDDDDDDVVENTIEELERGRMFVN